MEGGVMVRKYLVSRKFDLLAVLSVVMVLVLAGCGGNTSAHASSGTTAPLSSKASNSNIASATLKRVPEGTATISWDPRSQGLTVKISLIGMAPSSTHPAYIHAGSCAKQGAVVDPLQNVVADAHGVGSSTTVIKKVTTLSGRTLTVKLTLSGLQPKSSHAAHIHIGSCASQGAVVYPLQNVVADATGNANVTTTIKNVSSIPSRNWFVNVHYSTNISTQTGFNPIACGNVVVR